MKEFFQYFYYRWAKLNINTKYGYPTLAVTSCQMWIIFNLMLFMICSLDFLFNNLNLENKFHTLNKIAFVGLVFGLDYYNNKLYDGKYEEFDKKWGEETKNERRMGMLKIILFIIFSWGLIFINAWIFNRYKSY
jgi:hypothetical protein